MRDHARENLLKLLRRFMDEPTARAAREEIRAGERWLEAYEAPAPESWFLDVIKMRMAAAALRRHRIRQRVGISLSAAAAVVVLGLIGLLGPGSEEQPSMSYAAIIPAAVWESDDITTDDLDLAYFSSEIRQIEAQMQALDEEETDNNGNAVPEELEMELIAIRTDFWKG